MDKENIKMLREHIETYKKLRDESSVTTITFTTPGHCYGVEKNPEFIKPLLDTIIQVFETKLDIAIYGDVPIPLSESCEYKIAKKLEHAVNNYSFNPDRFAEAIPYMHRTLQQSIFRLIKVVSAIWRKLIADVLMTETEPHMKCVRFLSIQ